MFLHLFVAEKTKLREVMLCEVSSERGATRAGRVATECLHCVDPAELAKVRGEELPMHGDSPISARRGRSPSPWRPPHDAARGERRDSSDMERRSSIRGRSPAGRNRSNSLRRGENTRGARGARTGLLDIEMPHRCGLKAFVVIDCALVFAVVASPQASREAALPLLRAVRREFLSSFRPEQLADLNPVATEPFCDTLDGILRDSNSPGGVTARHQRPSWPVRLNIYNILDESTNARLSFVGMGLHHTGVEIHDREWSYGGVLPGSDRGDETGLFCIPPRTGMPQTHFKQTIDLGRTTKSPEQVDYIIETFMTSGEWRACDYHILNRNCNDFCQELVLRIGGWEFPSWINRAAKVSSTVLPEGMVNRILQQMQPPPATNPPQLKCAPSRPPEERTASQSRCATAGRRANDRRSGGPRMEHNDPYRESPSHHQRYDDEPYPDQPYPSSRRHY